MENANKEVFHHNPAQAVEKAISNAAKSLGRYSSCYRIDLIYKFDKSDKEHVERLMKKCPL